MMSKWLKNWRRQQQQKQETSGPGTNAVPPMAGEVHQLDVSEATLALLIQGQQNMLQRRQQLIAQVQEVDAAIQQQEGGIRMMRNLLGGKVTGKTGEVAATPAE